MIYCDGDRARKKLWFANKSLRVLQDLDLPATAKVLDGFRINVWQDGDLHGGNIFSPEGIVITCSTGEGIKIIVGDSFTAGITSMVDLSVLYTEGEGVRTSLYGSIPEDTENDPPYPGMGVYKFVPMGSLSPFGVIDETTSGETVVWEQDRHPIPGIMPFGEAFWLSVSGNMFMDLNENGLADRPRTTVESFLNFYSSDGSAIAGRSGFLLEKDNNVQPWRIMFSLPYADGIRQVEHQTGSYEAESGEIITCRIFTGKPADITKSVYLASDMWTGLPAGLKAIMLDLEQVTSMWPIGGYAYSPAPDSPATLLQAVNLTNTLPLTGESPAEEWFDTNPGNDKFKLFYSIFDGTTNHLVDSSQFIGLLDDLADVDILGSGTDWSNARRMLIQLLPWPNNNFYVPYDSAMFHSGNSIYSWTRKYGAVQFTTSGLFAAEINLPVEINTEGVRPYIVYCGDIYLCICDSIDKIEAVYIGSPFALWEKLTAIDPLYKLIHVRPCIVEGEIDSGEVVVGEIIMIGIAKKIETESEPAAFFYCLFREMEWKVMGKLPLTVAGKESWAMSLFGVGKITRGMQQFLSPPHVLPQMPVGTYDKYAIGMP
ncbi:MAG TPA: hypothetical protein DCZ63_15190 [Geobacter sp.]|nr:hypothetical protein [Geobacter sp.]